MKEMKLQIQLIFFLVIMNLIVQKSLILMTCFLKNWRYKYLKLTKEEIQEGLKNLPYIRKDFQKKKGESERKHNIREQILKGDEAE